MAKILVVEDDADLVETYTDLLEAYGHSVVCTSHIQDATTHVLEMQPDIITLDLNLPGNLSLVVSSFMYEAKALSRCKLIIISGHSEMVFGQSWMDVVDLVLTKPTDNQHLTMMIDRVLLT